MIKKYILPMISIIFYLILLVCSVSSEISESSNSEGIILIKTNENVPHFILVPFSKYFFPHLKDLSNIIYGVYKSKDKILAAFYSEKATSIEIKYTKPVRKIMNLDYKIKRGIVFDPVILVTKDGIFQSKPNMDIFPVPDFSIYFVSFNTCGSILGMVFNLLLNR